MKNKIKSLDLLVITRKQYMEDKEYPIPKNLNECFDVLNEIFNESESDKNWFKTSEEDDATTSLHHGLGMWIRNEWELWKKESDMYNYFNKMGLWHADDMSSVILTSYHRFINGKELELKEQINHHLDYWKDYEKTNGPIQK